MSLAAAGRVARVAPLRRARPPARRASRAPVAASAFPVFEKMVGKWEDNIRYVAPALDKTPVKLVGVREFAVEGDVVTLKSSTRFPNGKTLRLAFEGRRVKEAYGLKNVVRFDRVPWDDAPDSTDPEECEFPKTAPDDCYYPIVLLAAEHPGKNVLGLYPGFSDEPIPTYDVVIVREISVETGETVLAETITLIEHESIGTWAAHSAQEITADGELGGVQLWRSAHTSCAMPNEGKKGKRRTDSRIARS